MRSESAGEWATHELRTLTRKVRSGATPRGGTAAYPATRDKYALVRSQNVFDHRFESNGLAFITDAQACDLAGAELEVNDVLLNITGDGVTFGRSCLVPSHVLPACVNQHVMLIRVNPARCVAGYLASWLTLPETKGYIESFNAGGSRRAITKGHIEAFQVPLPPLHVQSSIAAFTDTINHRIDLLRQTNVTLESIAQAVFKSWFVDFDPVRAKAEGREPESMDAVTAAMFPSEFEESALGLIPKGWMPGRFGDLAELAKGSVNPLATPEEKFEHYSLPAFDAGQLPIIERGESIKSNKTRVPFGAVLQSKLNPHIPRVWLPSKIGANAVCSTEFLPWVAKPCASSELIYCTLTSRSFEASVRTLVTGTSNSHQRVKPAQVAALELLLAPLNIVAAFTQVVRPLMSKVGENRLTVSALAELRDSLLPRLVSGKLRLPDAEEVLSREGVLA